MLPHHLLSTFYHFLPLLPMHLAESQAIPPLFTDFTSKKTQPTRHPLAPELALEARTTDLKRAVGIFLRYPEANPLKQHIFTFAGEKRAQKTSLRTKTRPEPQTSFQGFHFLDSLF